MLKTTLRLVVIFGTVLGLATSRSSFAEVLPKKPFYLATIPPVAMILREVLGADTEIQTVLPPSVSPHTFQPTPAQRMRSRGARMVFSVGKNLDGWVSRFKAPLQVELLSFLSPTDQLSFEDHGTPGKGGHHPQKREVDPHFWLDPLNVQKILPFIVEAVCEIPGATIAECVAYTKRFHEFSKKLSALDLEIKNALEPIKGRGIVLFHPSFAYFIKRYELKLVAVIQPSPGQKPSQNFLDQVVQKMREQKIAAVFSEPQLPARLAEEVAQKAKVKLSVLDPKGGVPGRLTYFELLRFNAAQLLKALQ